MSHSNMLKIEFFTGPHCELCDHALDVISTLKALEPSVQTMSFEMLNIRDNPEHYHLYAVRIPVLRRVDSGAELGWPFDLEALKKFLSL
jgi:hypothetical protein